MQPAGVSEWAAAALNRPLTTGDKVWSDRDSRAELDIGAAVISGRTPARFLNLDDYTAQMQPSRNLIVRVRELQPGQIYEVDTPNLAVLLQQPGEYRIEVNEAGDYTVVKVSEGAAQASGGGQTIAIGAQQAVSFSGTDTLAYQSATLGAPDDLDSWSGEREQQLEDSTSREYVADDVAGTQDLDNNGTWMNTPEYGYVWAPTVVVVGWAPYRFGHWVWITPWGWSWVDDLAGATSVSLRALGSLQQQLVLGAGPAPRASCGVRAGARRVGRRCGYGRWPRWRSVVSARAARGLCTRLPREPGIRTLRQHH
jgi:hypothetical protein